MIVRSFAPAKINLFLHVGRPRADGMHPMESMAAFALGAGDWVEAEHGDDLSLEVDGPFGDALAGEPDNLVLRAARALADAAGRAPLAKLRLEKHLPIASGVGGGSADAAAALRTLNVLWEVGAPPEGLEAIARALGSDVPVCVQSRTRSMRGLGADLGPADAAPLACLLVNPLQASPTGPVYRAFDELMLGDGFAPFDAPTLTNASAMLTWLRQGRNDLEAPATRLTPVIAEVLETLRAVDPAALVRLSGSGATCFALFKDLQEAERVQAEVLAHRPAWWACATLLGSVDVAPRLRR
jgi:4-diphosphocytidyl-2-C-methyl-D-erythritol kinase